MPLKKNNRKHLLIQKSFPLFKVLQNSRACLVYAIGIQLLFKIHASLALDSSTRGSKARFTIYASLEASSQHFNRFQKRENEAPERETLIEVDLKYLLA